MSIWGKSKSAAKFVFVKIPAGADVVRGEGDRHMGVCRATANDHGATFSVLTLLRRQAQTIAEKGFDQHDHLTAIRRPHAGFGQRQRHMVVGAAFAAAYAGKRRIH